MKMVNNCRFVAAGQKALIAHEKHQQNLLHFNYVYGQMLAQPIGIA